MGHSSSYLVGESSGDHTTSSTASTSTSQLPSRHPLLMHQEVPQEHTTPLGFAAHREATSAATASQSLPVLDHSENTIPQSSSALAQLLSTSSAHDVLRLNRSGMSGTHTATTTGSQDVGHTDTEDPGNQTSIPSTYSRWSEECEALDGSIQHLCINCIKPSIIASLEKTFEKENKRKAEEKGDDKGQSSTAMTDSTATSSSLERAVRNRIATAAANVNSAIDNLHASLQSVASSLAGTAELVRSELSSAAMTSSTLSNRGDNNTGSEMQESGSNELPLPSAMQENNSTQQSTAEPPVLVPFTETQATTNTVTITSDSLTTPVQSSAMPTLQPLATPAVQVSATPTVQSSATPIAPPSVTSVPPLTTPTVSFDGSQASAAAILQNTDPTDPMYMFLSAVAGAPAPPLPESSSATTTAPSTQEVSEDEVLQRRATSDALRIASRIAEMLNSDTLPLPGDDNNEGDDQDDEEVTEVTTQSDIVASSLASSLAASLVQSLTTSNSTSPCTTLAPQLSSSLQVHQAVNESSQSVRSEMVGDIIPLTGNIIPVVPSQQLMTTVATTTTSNNTAAGAATTDVLSSMPEELDSTFLEALPDSIREELVLQHAAEMRRRQFQSQAGRSGDNFVSTISPEFLAALPPNIQEEVSC